MKLPKNSQLWLPSYVKGRMRRMLFPTKPKRLWVAHTDHFEPYGNTTLSNAHKRLSEWEHRWPEIAAMAPRDAEGNAPCFTLFYPQEEYERELLKKIAALTKDRTIDVEVHLHHFNDTADSFAEKIRTFTRRLYEEHGLLRKQDGQIAFGFIHGNWALDNSHPEGFACGVTGELQALRDLGCYADFTMPSLPSPTQSRIVNQIYWTNGDPARPRGFDQGSEAAVGGGRRGDLLMITGPTGLRYRGRLLPRMESGELASYDLPTLYRVNRWIDLAPQLGEDIFVKLYGHSAREDNAAALLGSGSGQGGLSAMYRWFAEAAQQRHLDLHWASAYSMYQAVERLLAPGAEKKDPETVSL